MKTVYISPDKPSEVVPLLAEGLLLYDKVIYDLTYFAAIEILAANIDSKTMENLIDNNIVNFVYQDFAPVIMLKEGKSQIALFNYKQSDFPTVEEVMDREFKKVYPLSLIEKIMRNTCSVNLNYDEVVHNTLMDLQNNAYLQMVFSYVQSNFALPDFEVIVEDDGTCSFNCSSLSPSEEKEFKTSVSFGLHIMTETNFKLALLSLYDELMCEKEYEIFFERKLNAVFQMNTSKQHSENFLKLCTIHNFPDIKELVSSGLFTIQDVINLRNKDGRFLREWIDSVTQQSITGNIPFSEECAKIFCKGDKKFPLAGRAVAFGLLQALSIVKPVEAGILSAAQEFIMPKVLEQWKPRFFFDKARKLYIQKQQVTGS